MKFKEFLKDKFLMIILLLFILITIEIFLIPYNFGRFIKIYIPVAIIVAYFIGIAFEYNTKKNFYSNYIQTLEELEEKYLITEIINTPEFIEGKLLKQTLSQINKSMLENVNKYKYMRRGI